MTGDRPTKERIIDATLETLRVDGFAGTSARTIARRGGLNQALIFYHFGTINDLLLAALDRAAMERREHYEEAMRDAADARDLIEVAARLYREDLEAGHITVLSELIAGSLTEPSLGPEIVARMQPWIDLAEGAIARAIEGTFVRELVQPRDLAFALVALYLGVDLLTQLDGDHARAESLFEVGRRLTVTMSMLEDGAD
ncbi:MAG: TetR family transcriptional regulator [Actinobacteria bacterium]|nr:TetR family transcriptional regulator [Actinomycetota bacterium]